MEPESEPKKIGNRNKKLNRKILNFKNRNGIGTENKKKLIPWSKDWLQSLNWRYELWNLVQAKYYFVKCLYSDNERYTNISFELFVQINNKSVVP